MWLLECDGNVFNHKRLWLRPGKSYLFGRTRPPADQASPHERSFAIANRSVSRKHLVIAVAAVNLDGHEQMQQRSQITLTDDSKFGTSLDGHKFIKEKRRLSGAQHIITLGSFEQTFKISWHQVSFCFSFTDKQIRSNKDALAPLRQRFAPYDITTTLDYSVSSTTHVVSNKRNIAKGLQALINAKHIVTDSFVVAVESAAGSPGFEDDGVTPIASALEEDFDGSWPRALDYLPGPGKEPHPRSADLFGPNERRLNLFDGFTFIFADSAQFRNLSPALQNGGAKCLQYNLILGQTSLQEFVQYVKDVAGLNGTGNFDNGNEGVAVVRFRGEGKTAQWALDFIRNLDRELEQRSIEQNEFLDAILLNDTSNLRRPLREAASANVPLQSASNAALASASASATAGQDSRQDRGTSAQRLPTSAQEEDVQIKEPPSSAQKETSAEASQGRRKIRRTAAKSRFKGFDDFDDENFEPKHMPSSPPVPLEEDNEANPHNIAAQHHPGQVSGGMLDPASQPLFVDDNDSGNEVQAQSNKRKASSTAEIEEDLFPAAAAMKRRRVAQNQESGEEQADVNQPTQKATRSRKPELDVRSAARSHATDLDRLKQEWRSDDGEGGSKYDAAEDVSALRDLAIIEEMEVKPRTRSTTSQRAQSQRTTSRQQGQGEADSQRWLPEWNGRKNFKKFRPKGADPAVNRGTGNRVIVRLEEAQKRDSAADDLMGENEATSRAHGSSSQLQGQGGHRPVHTSNDDVEDDELLPEEVAGTARDPIVAQRIMEGQAEAASQQQPARATRTTTASRASKKRSAADAAAGSSSNTRPPAKRVKQTTRKGDSDDDDEDDDDEPDPMAFKFRRRR